MQRLSLPLSSLWHPLPLLTDTKTVTSTHWTLYQYLRLPFQLVRGDTYHSTITATVTVAAKPLSLWLGEAQRVEGAYQRSSESRAIPSRVEQDLMILLNWP